MISANSFVDLHQNIFGLFLVDTPQVGHGEASLVQGIVQDCEPCCPLPCSFDVLWEPSVLKEGQDWGHRAAFTLDCEGVDFFNTGASLDFNL